MEHVRHDHTAKRRKIFGRIVSDFTHAVAYGLPMLVGDFFSSLVICRIRKAISKMMPENLRDLNSVWSQRADLWQRPEWRALQALEERWRRAMVLQTCETVS